MEEGFMLVFPELVGRGEVPNRDFLHLYGPGGLWVLAGAYELFGTTLTTERLVAFAQQLGVAFGVFALLRHWGRGLAAAGGIIAAVVILPPIGLTALAWVGAVALGLWALTAGLAAGIPTRAGHGGKAVGPAARPRLLLMAGMLAGLALLYRPDLVVAVGASGTALALGLDRVDRRRLLAGLAAGVSPYLVHVATAGFGDAFRGMVLDPVFALRGGRALPLPPTWDSFDGFLQRAGLLAEPSWPFPAPASPAQLTIWLVLLVAADVALVVAGARLLRRTGDRRLLVMGLFAAGLLPQALQRADSTHLAWVSCVPFGLAPAAVAELARTWRPRLASPRVALVAVAVPVAAVVGLVPDFTARSYADYVAQSAGYGPPSYRIERGERWFYYGRQDAALAVTALFAVIDEHTEPGDTLFVGTGDLRKTPYSEAFLYHLLPELPPATRYIEMDPGVANADDSGLADEVAAADVLILSSIRDDWVEPNDSRRLGPDEPNQVVARDFCLRGSFGDGLFGRGLYELYTRCDAG
ncbi:MAG: hypothetical protein H0V33_02790 [Acidimicrobiia bacterium]|jgi:hypothetical protein|nr:hypothetical protein [Acidimicrobiia bacterium]